MLKKITVSAPGKLMLFGEHAVVYEHPCIVTAVNRRMRVTVEILDSPQLELHAPDVDISQYVKPMSELGKGEIPKGARFVEMAVKNFLGERDLHEKGILKLVQDDVGGVRGDGGGGVWSDNVGFRITTSSEFSSKFGFGSSSATVVCVIKALSVLFARQLSEKEVFDLAYKTVLDVQGKGSGFDVAAAVYGGTLYFFTGGKVIERLDVTTLPLVVGYSGVKADTVTLIKKVRDENKQPTIDGIYRSIEALVASAKSSITANDWENVGKLMNENQTALASLGVSIPKLDAMIFEARGAGAYGAKLSGAGGGDCMIAVVSDEERLMVEKSIEKAGGEILSVQCNAEGVRVE